MHRRLAFAVTVCAFLAPGTALANFQDDLVEWLQGQGYSEISVTRTLLGRTRIVATGSDGTRELILNPRTGEVLRDIWTNSRGQSLPPALADNSGRGGDGRGDDNGGGGEGGDNDDDNDEDAEDDHGGGDDNSGHGGEDEDGGDDSDDDKDD